MQKRRLHSSEIFQPGEAVHFTRAVLSKRPIRLIHDHDFPEVFWLQHGRARHLVNGARDLLREGDLVFIRPSDSHGLQGLDDQTHLVNIAFAPALIEAIGTRHDMSGRFFWSAASTPETAHRDIRQLADLSRAALRLETGPRDALAAEAFLLPLLSELQGRAGPLPEALPDWLARACAAAHEPEVFRDGAAGLARMSGRAHAHVSRTMQRHFGETPSDYVNRIRMDHAARALTGSSDPLAEIATEIGLPNLSHFHRLFRTRFGMTPADYRRRHQKNAIQPV